MVLYDLMLKYDLNIILDRIELLYGIRELDRVSFESSILEMLTTKPSTIEQEFVVTVREEVDELEFSEDLVLQCYGTSKNNKQEKWCLSFDSWNEWLAKEVDCSSVDEITALAVIIMEMTLYGNTSDKVLKKSQELKETEKEDSEFNSFWID